MPDTRPVRTSFLLVVVIAILGIGAPSAGSEPGAQVIRLVWVKTSNHPNGKKSSWTSLLLNATPQFGRPVGAKVGAEVGISHGPQYVGGIKLPGGVLEYSGKVKHLPHHAGIVVPVVDGSGVFAGVTGTYTLTYGDKIILVLRLDYG